LIDYLQESLHLPEFGEVVIRMVIKHDGGLMKLTSIEAKSTQNKDYLEEALPLLTFPSMDQKIKDAERSFIITFCNKDSDL